VQVFFFVLAIGAFITVTIKTGALDAGIGLNHWALSGQWTAGEQAATMEEAEGRIVYASGPATFNWSWDRQHQGSRCASGC
jgi:hypothetical protein